MQLNDTSDSIQPDVRAHLLVHRDNGMYSLILIYQLKDELSSHTLRPAAFYQWFFIRHITYRMTVKIHITEKYM
jgi:hypothetical protein